MATDNRKITKETLRTGFLVLARYLKSRRREITLLSVLGVVSALGNGTVPFIAGRFFDSIIKPTDINLLDNFTIPLYTLLLSIWAIVQFITYLVDWRIAIKSERFSNSIWGDYLGRGMGRLLELPMAFHKKNKVGTIGEKINRAANALESIIGQIIITLAPQFLSIAIALVVGIYIKPILALILVAGVILYIFILSRSVAPLAEIQKKLHDAYTETWGDMYDALGNVHAVKQATAERHEQTKIFSGLKGRIFGLWIRMSSIWSNLSLYQKMVILGTQLTIFIVSVSLITKGEMTIGSLLAFNAYATMVFGPFVVIGQNWQVIQNGLVNLSEAEKIIGMETETYVPAGLAQVSDINGDVVFENVSFNYEEGKAVLQDVSFSVKAGNVIALVGESGVGKSTLIDLVSAYHFPTKGVVRIDGNDTKKINLKLLRSKIAVVPQEVVLFNDTIRHNIHYGNFDAGSESLKNAAEKAHALDFIEKFPSKWDQLVGERGIKLSVGQKQRIAIARAILRNPRILILDEPTSALDAGSEKIITGSLEELMKGKTTFIIAHRLSTVRKANIILVFKGGKIIESGTHNELVQKQDGEYRRLYELQIGLHG